MKSDPRNRKSETRYGLAAWPTVSVLELLTPFRLGCLVFSYAWFSFLMALGLPAGAAEPPASPRNEVLTIGLTRTAFLGLNRNDMEAALKVLAQTVGRKRGYQVQVRTQYYEDAPAFAQAIQTGAVRLAIADSWTYLGMRLGDVATPCFVSMEQKKVGKPYFLLSRRESGLDSLANLRGRKLALLEVVNSSLGRPWLETLLLSNRLGSSGTFFSEIHYVGKPSAAVLPVFFGKMDACLVDGPAFSVMTELNPQVGKDLQIIASSEALVDGLDLVSVSGWGEDVSFKRDVIEAIGELHLEPAGQQLLTLFKTDQMVPYADEQLDAVRRLRATHDALSKEATP